MAWYDQHAPSELAVLFVMLSTIFNFLVDGTHNHSQYQFLFPAFLHLLALAYLPSLILLAIGGSARLTGCLVWGVVLRIIWQAVGYPLFLVLLIDTLLSGSYLGERTMIGMYTVMFPLPAYFCVSATRELHTYCEDLGGGPYHEQLVYCWVDHCPSSALPDGVHSSPLVSAESEDYDSTYSEDEEILLLYRNKKNDEKTKK